MRLHHAASDARAFHHYVSTAWKGDEHRHSLLVDRKATGASVARVFQEMESAGSFDLFFAYLSGHGELHPNGRTGWFCLSDARPGEPGLDGASIERFLADIDAGRVVLIVDCCHAESITTGLRFFGSLEPSGSHPSMRRAKARVFVASSRSDQRSWEDGQLGRSVFSHVLMRALSTESDIVDGEGRVDLEARLLPHLRDQVPLSAIVRKSGRAQEPVSGGLSVAETRMPIVTRQAIGRDLSVAETVRIRVGKALRIMGGLALVGLLIVETLFFHMATTGSGEIVIRPGLKQTYGIMPFHLTPEIATGIALTDMRDGVELLEDLEGGSLLGITSHRDGHGMRPWLARIDHRIGNRAASVRLMTTGEYVSFDPEIMPPPVREAGFLATLSEKPVSEIAKALFPLDYDVDIPIDNSVESVVDFRLLDRSDLFELDADWLAVTASSDPVGRARNLVGLVRLAGYQAVHASGGEEADAQAKFFAFARAARKISMATDDAVNPDAADVFVQAAEEDLLELRDDWAGDFARIALAMLPGQRGHREDAERHFLDIVRSAYDDTGANPLPTLGQARAVAALASLASVSSLRGETVAGLEELARRGRLDLVQPEPANSVLRSIAGTQRLPSSLLDDLVLAMEEDQDDFGFGRVGAFGVLTMNACFSTELLARVNTWASKHLEEEAGMSYFHEGLGHLAMCNRNGDLGPLSDEQVAVLDRNLTLGTRFTPPEETYAGTTVIAVTGDDAAVALGRVLQAGVLLSGSVVDRLANVAMGRPDLESRTEILDGLSALWYSDSSLQGLASVVVGRLREFRHDTARRMLESEVAARRLAGLEDALRGAILDDLIVLWRSTPEPELRMTLAETIGLARALAT